MARSVPAATAFVLGQAPAWPAAPRSRKQAGAYPRTLNRLSRLACAAGSVL